MRLYVICPSYGQRIYISPIVEHRHMLAQQFYLSCPYDGNVHLYSNNDVIPEAESGALIAGAIAGGLVGLIGGPVGFILGGTIGAVLGASSEEEEITRVRRFG